MGAGPIPWSSMVRYASLIGIRSVDEFEQFAQIVRAVDDEYLVLTTPGLGKTEKRISVENVEGTKAVLKFAEMQRREKHGRS